MTSQTFSVKSILPATSTSRKQYWCSLYMYSNSSFSTSMLPRCKDIKIEFCSFTQAKHDSHKNFFLASSRDPSACTLVLRAELKIWALRHHYDMEKFLCSSFEWCHLCTSSCCHNKIAHMVLTDRMTLQQFFSAARKWTTWKKIHKRWSQRKATFFCSATSWSNLVLESVERALRGWADNPQILFYSRESGDDKGTLMKHVTKIKATTPPLSREN